ncbi:hypothetical protein [Catellatospora tritici]|uniref:hypothetical protein n=1 Tax=Catellatospora tritici TaxID=2851566 RepID=UPI001C2D7087|nr:hypothetical protein [Catellatospora tritici]MBV1853024.1 hypothetical protein [Catellatospora tritici]
MTSLGGVRRIAGLVLIVVAVLAGAAGAFQLRTLTWDKTQAAVETCTQHSTGTGAKRHFSQECAVSWTEGATTHRATLTFEGPTDLSRTTQEILVSGDQAVPGGAPTAAFVFLGGALLFLLVGLVARFGGAKG